MSLEHFFFYGFLNFSIKSVRPSFRSQPWYDYSNVALMELPEYCRITDVNCSRGGVEAFCDPQVFHSTDVLYKGNCD